MQIADRSHLWRWGFDFCGRGWEMVVSCLCVLVVVFTGGVVSCWWLVGS